MYKNLSPAARVYVADGSIHALYRTHVY